MHYLYESPGSTRMVCACVFCEVMGVVAYMSSGLCFLSWTHCLCVLSRKVWLGLKTTFCKVSVVGGPA